MIEKDGSVTRELDESISDLIACRAPWLIGVRHHSAALAGAMETLLDRFVPAAVLVELPSDFAPWLEYLADPQTVAPVALSAVGPGGTLAFYPLADFSPEYVAVRWAFRVGVPVVPCDLSVSAQQVDREADDSNDAPAASQRPASTAGMLASLLRRTQAKDTGQLWERLVESPVIGDAAEAIRRAGLAFGWAVRHGGEPVATRDLIREAAMRQAIRQAPPHAVAVVGAFHAPVLTQQAIAEHAVADAAMLGGLQSSSDPVGVSLVPYGFEELDERSGYPAGIRDPVWHQRMLDAASPAAKDAAATELVVEIVRTMRRRGHAASTPDAMEVIRMMRDLARLRQLPAPGRSELVEALSSCLTHGEINGRAREVAKAAEQVLVGKRRGQVASRTPRCGLAVAIDQLLQTFSLPGLEQAKEPPREIRLDILRSPRDRAKALLLRRLCLLGIPYAQRTDTIATDQRENLIECWEVGWRQGTAATIEAVSRWGVTLQQAASASLRSRFTGERYGFGKPDAGTPPGSDGDEAIMLPSQFLERLQLAAECGLTELLTHDLRHVEGRFLPTAGLTDIAAALTLWGRIAAGHIAALPIDPAEAYPPHVMAFDPAPYRRTASLLLQAALQRLDGISGSQERQDVIGFCDLAQWFYDSPQQNPARLIGWCQRTLQSGSAAMRGATAGTLRLYGQMDDDALQALLSGWFDQATSKEGRQLLRWAVYGCAQVLFPQMLCDPDSLAGLELRLRDSSDAEFLSRLPALRGAFHEFSPQDRQRLLRVRLEQYADRGSGWQWGRSAADYPETLAQQSSGFDAAWWTAVLRDADLRGCAAIQQELPEFVFDPDSRTAEPTAFAGDLADKQEASLEVPNAADEPSIDPEAGGTDSMERIPLGDRWRMILGVAPETRLPACRAAMCLDELYGHGKGEGARGDIGNRGAPPRGGGDEAPQPSTVEWSDDLEQLFGSDVCQEVLGEAVEGGRLSAVQRLDPAVVTPSVDLLRQVLSLAGGLPEQRAERLRTLAKRITAALAEQLAVRLQPALHGLASPRPTRRRGHKLHLPRTIRDNLAHVYRRPDGKPRVIAQRLVFQSTAKREMDWHLTFVVDVSGSMTASIIYSAICAAVFAELPALSVRFLAFSTEVIDLSDKVADPLSLLLEVQVGGGTRIGLGLAAARAQIKVPQRTLLVLVSDFEEGVSLGEMLAEIQELVGAGVRCLGLAALDDSGAARFHHGYAKMAAAAGMSVAAVAPEQLARWVGDQIRSSTHGAANTDPESLG